MFRIAHHLKSIKNKIKSWKIPSGPNYEKQIEKNTEKLHYVENHLIGNADNPRLTHWHNRLIKQREKLMLFHQRFWGRLVRKQWLIDGDPNSRFFHQMVTARKRCTFISRIKNEVGGWIRRLIEFKPNFVKIFNSDLLPVTIPILLLLLSQYYRRSWNQKTCALFNRLPKGKFIKLSLR